MHQHPAHFRGVLAGEVRDVLGARLAVRVRLEVALRPEHRVQLPDHVHRQPDGARLVHDRALDVLPDPPGGVSREAKAALRVELVERVHEAEVAFLHEVEERHAAVEIALGDVHHQAQIVLDHLLARGEIAGRRAPREVQLLPGREQAVETDLVQIELGRVAQGAGFFRGDFARRRARSGLRRLIRDLALGALGDRERRRDCIGRIAPGPVRLGIALGSARAHDGRSGRNFSGSTGLPRRRISKWSFAWGESVLPISAIFWPFPTFCPSFTKMLLLWP